MKQIDFLFDDIEHLAEQCAGNWREFSSFAWSTQYDLINPDRWYIFYICNRDSGLLNQSNAAAIDKRLARFVSRGDILDERHNHWACGWVDGYAVKVYTTRGKVTRAFEEVASIKQSLAEYPILDEEDYSEREYNAAIDGIQQSARYDTEIDVLELPDEWEEEVFSWLWNSEQSEVENSDDTGAYPSGESIERALVALEMI